MEERRVSQVPAEIPLIEPLPDAVAVPPAPDEEIDAPGPATPTLKQSAIRASAWAVVGSGGSLTMRFVSSILITRLLEQHLLGLVAIAQLVLEALAMLSDVGIAQSVIQNRRSEEESFLRTAWTMHVIRGVVLGAGTALVAVPVAAFYGDRTFLALVPVVGLTAIISGFTSMSLFLLKRHMAMGKITALELSSNAVGVSVTLTLAWLSGSLWSVPVGQLTTCALITGASHFVLPGVRMGFRWDRDAARAMIHFGKWIYFGSIVMYLSRASDKLTLGRILSTSLGNVAGMSYLAVYNYALLLSEVASNLATQVTYNVLFPAYSRVAREGAERLRDVYYRSRLWIDLGCTFGTGGISGAAPWIVRFMFDDRYLDAGWMLRALAVRAGMMCMLVPCESVLFAQGHTRYNFWRNLARGVWVLAGVPLGWWVAGMPGVITVMALTELPVLLVLWPAARKHGVFRWKGELRSAALFAAGFTLGLLFLWLMPPIRVGPALRHIADVLHLRAK
jgi:O-antigen/teichoic acid export membrane protein